MNQIIENLFELQTLEESGDANVDRLRKRIPNEVLYHYDRLRLRGRHGVAIVRRGVCGQCHMQVAIGLLASLRRMDNIHCCQNCGAYLSVVEETPVETPVENKKRVRHVSGLVTATAMSPSG
jgi:predicted  nucleic acid-binding Zn-ribbon protein